MRNDDALDRDLLLKQVRAYLAYMSAKITAWPEVEDDDARRFLRRWLAGMRAKSDEELVRWEARIQS